jgi:hypothetical protein
MESVEAISNERNVLRRAACRKHGRGCRMSYDFWGVAGLHVRGMVKVMKNLPADIAERP